MFFLPLILSSRFFTFSPFDRIFLAFVFCLSACSLFVTITCLFLFWFVQFLHCVPFNLTSSLSFFSFLSGKNYLVLYSITQWSLCVFTVLSSFLSACFLTSLAYICVSFHDSHQFQLWHIVFAPFTLLLLFLVNLSLSWSSHCTLTDSFLLRPQSHWPRYQLGTLWKRLVDSEKWIFPGWVMQTRN